MRTWHQDFPILLIPYAISGLVFATPMAYSRGFRESFLNICVTPFLTIEQATSLQLWWVRSSMIEEIAIGVLISLNAALPLMLVLYVAVSLQHKAVRFTKVGQLKEITDKFHNK
ncbi:MAG: hypothetical protein ACPGF8_07610 [Opitutales bacterium]